jgi:hypothetical protein
VNIGSLLKWMGIGAAMWLLCQIVACTTNSVAPKEFLDPQTAATITTVGRPMVLARPRPELAANVRDYVTLSTVAVNRSGNIRYYWIAYFWSTLDARVASLVTSGAAEPAPLLAVDDRRIAFGQRIESAESVGIGIQPHRPAGVTTEAIIYPVTLNTLRFVAAGRQIKLYASADPTEISYELWDDQRAALAEFVRSQSH